MLYPMIQNSRYYAIVCNVVDTVDNSQQGRTNYTNLIIQTFYDNRFKLDESKTLSFNEISILLSYHGKKLNSLVAMTLIQKINGIGMTLWN